MQAITGEAMDGILATIGSHSPQLAGNLVTHAFGSVISDPALGYGARELATIAMLGAMGGCEGQLRTHLRFALDCGLTPEEIVACAEHVSVYAGYPRALTMLRIAREVLQDRGEKLLVAQPFRLRDHTTRLFDSGGDEPPMLLLHALGLDWRMWSRVIPLLTSHYRVIAFDLRGFGGAAFAPHVRDLAHYAEDVADLLDRLDLPQAHITGLSLGGSIALELALQRPDPVAGLTVIAATAWSFPAFEQRARAAEAEGMEAQIIPSLTRWLRAGDLATNGWAVRYARNCVRRAGIADWSAAWRCLAGISLGDRLGDIRAPMRIIAGECDQSTPPGLMEGLVSEFRRDFTVIPGAPHMLALTHPKALGSAIVT
ncbi:carboxymuconolactone decarboxylase [Salipiger aestuarii]|nr:carboxymuconolactone decarboxylase [Salipiger aestuarii]